MNEDTLQFISGNSDRTHGSMTKEGVPAMENVEPFLSSLEIPAKKVHFMKQVHGKNVTYVNGRSKRIIDKTDGLITDKPDVFLGVVTADCIPLLLADQKSHVVGVAHAGYKGVLLGVVQNLFNAALKLGSYPEDIFISIGPSIGVCCYNIDEERVKRFSQLFRDNKIFRFSEDTVFLDLKKAVRIILEKEGIPKENITVSSICTQCNKDKYFSYRADTDQTSGTFLTVVGMKNN